MTLHTHVAGGVILPATAEDVKELMLVPPNSINHIRLVLHRVTAYLLWLGHSTLLRRGHVPSV